MNPKEIVNRLASIRTDADSFNPYSQRCIVHDKVNGHLIRCKNLELYLEAQIANKPMSLWIAEAPGYMGMRRTGVPLVPENLLEYASKKFRTRERFSKATKTPIQKARTANAVWEAISRFDNPPFLWDIVMLHPHHSGNPMSNRQPRQDEIKLYLPLLRDVMDAFRFKKIIAIGKVAEKALRKLGIHCIYVRHPAHGGKSRFQQQIKALYAESSKSAPTRFHGSPG